MEMTQNIEIARKAFAEFERDMTQGSSINSLREGLDYALDVIEDPSFDQRSKYIARNIIISYKEKLLEKISTVLDDNGSFEDDYYWHFIDLINLFENMGFDEDNRLSEQKVELALKAFSTLSNDERLTMIDNLQHGLGT